MHPEASVTHIVRSWLRADEHESADRVLGNVLAALDTTPQRRSWGPARRITDMNNFAKLGIAAAAVVVGAVIGINLVPASGGVGGTGRVPHLACLGVRLVDGARRRATCVVDQDVDATQLLTRRRIKLTCGISIREIDNDIVCRAGTLRIQLVDDADQLA